MSLTPDQYRKPATTWMVIFADVLALLLTFFVLLFSMNSVKIEGWQAIVDTFSERLNPARPETVAEVSPVSGAAKVYRSSALDLDYLSNILEVKVSDHPLLGQGLIRRFDDRLVFSVPTDLLFEPGAARLAPGNVRAVAELGEMFRSVSNRISVAGHAERLADSDGEFANHWDLSLARAVRIASAIRAAGYFRHVPAFGEGNARFDILEDGPRDLDGGRFARRIDIVIEKAGSGR